jgi:type II secretory pathway component PulC
MRAFNLKWQSITTNGEAIASLLSRSPFTWTGLSALLLGLMLAKWFWVFFTPSTLSTSSLPERAVSSEVGQLFGRSTQGSEISTSHTQLNIQLLGVFASNREKPGFAILKLADNRQVGIAEGEEISAGTRLIKVKADHVLVDQHGSKQQIYLEKRNTSAAVAPPSNLTTSANTQYEQAVTIVKKHSQLQR